MTTRSKKTEMAPAQIAERWAGEKCQLNGSPAKIAGRLSQFARVVPLNPDLAIVEYSWYAVQRIMESGGMFK